MSEELILLRDFFAKWSAFHLIPRDGKHDADLQQAAQAMVDASHAVMKWKKRMTEQRLRTN